MTDKINPMQAAGLYKNAQGVADIGKSQGDDGVSFSSLVKNAALDSLSTLRGGEKASAEAVTGDASMTDVVEAVTAAELTLQTVVAVRDRMMSAYQEIMRMPV
jgi:flagellar hook-basal body complex protein FliE